MKNSDFLRLQFFDRAHEILHDAHKELKANQNRELIDWKRKTLDLLREEFEHFVHNRKNDNTESPQYASVKSITPVLDITEFDNKYDSDKTLELKIKHYLEQAAIQKLPIKIKSLKESLNIPHISSERIQNIAKKHNISIVFSYRETSAKEYNHGIRNTKNKCDCDICKLATTIKSRFFYQGRNLLNHWVDKFANELIDQYKYDDSPKHQKFWTYLDAKVTDSMLSKETKPRKNKR